MTEPMIDLPVMEPVDGGWRYATTERCHIDICPMIFNHRVVETPLDDPMTYGRYWCFANMTIALVALRVWDLGGDSEPVGWIKSWDQRYGEGVLRG